MREDGGGGGRAAPHPIFGDALSPIDRITEVFCGLVMVLTVTLRAVRAASSHRHGPRDGDANANHGELVHGATVRRE